MTIKTVYLVASGDFRESANKKCWERQSKVEESVTKVSNTINDLTYENILALRGYICCILMTFLH